MAIPETKYATTVDGVHIAYQVVGDGPTDIVYSAGFVSNVDTAWEEGHQEAFFRGLATLGRFVIFDWIAVEACPTVPIAWNHWRWSSGSTTCEP